ncbi:hypothetical protein M3J07_002764 [Ascochyta lentis]
MQHSKRPWDLADDSTSQYQSLPTKRVHPNTNLSYEDSNDRNLRAYMLSTLSGPGHSSIKSDSSHVVESDWTNDVGYNWPDQQLSDSERLLEEVCFGLVPDMRVRLSKDFDSILDFYLTALPGVHEPVLTGWLLSFADDRCNIVAPSGRPAAVLNQASFRLFDRIRRDGLVRVELSEQSLRSLKSTRSKNETSGRYTHVDMIIFGPRSYADEVATRLASEEVFLQDPDDMPVGFAYENPQTLVLPGNLPVAPARHENQVTSVHVAVPDTSSGLLDSRGSAVDFENLLNTFACHRDLVQATTDLHILTELLDHQREALAFIMQQESGSKLKSRGLWELQEITHHHDNTDVYQHTITGAKSISATETTGGIIADEMGLGKTLTMLSAITESLNRAFAYAKFVTNVDPSGRGIIAAKCTLVIVPSTLLIGSWFDEVDRHIASGTLNCYKFHGPSRQIGLFQLLQYDVIFTTYGTVASDFLRNRSLLHEIHWYRVVLDEAHVIRNASTKQFKAIQSLRSHIRWSLTGTPIQNTLNDLASLTSFLKVPLLEEATQFKRYITAPIESMTGNTSTGYQNLQKLLHSICLRRTKDILPTAQYTDLERSLDLDPDEREDYTRIERVCREALIRAVSGHDVGKAHQTVLNTLLRLRLYCNHGKKYGQASDSLASECEDPEEVLSLLEQSGITSCAYCDCDVTAIMTPENNEEALLTTCRKLICAECVAQWRSDFLRHNICPVCQSAHSMDTVVAEKIPEEPFEPYPSKIRALCQDIQANKEDGKCIVFSYWRRSLDVVGALLKEQNITYVRVDGSLPSAKRRSVLDQFQKQEDVSVLLMTLGTGAVGLNNLSVAHRLHLLEPQWNPSVESQAIGRVVRLGQTRPVTVIRYIMKRTVEEHVRRIQLRKHNLASQGFAQTRQETRLSNLNRLREILGPD